MPTTPIQSFFFHIAVQYRNLMKRKRQEIKGQEMQYANTQLSAVNGQSNDQTLKVAKILNFSERNKNRLFVGFSYAEVEI